MEMKKLGTPIYYFGKMDYEVSNPLVLEQEDTSYRGEVSLETHYQCINLKDGKEMKGIAYHQPNCSTKIPSVMDAVNVIQEENGEYRLDPDLSFMECANALAELIQEGKSMAEVTCADVKERVQEYAKEL
ncbi:MAG: hypothetical protein J6X28_00770 [Bacilli bacterium]|nr:hypothetical protein [Bacilli bacterium]